MTPNPLINIYKSDVNIPKHVRDVASRKDFTYENYDRFGQFLLVNSRMWTFKLQDKKQKPQPQYQDFSKTRSIVESYPKVNLLQCWSSS